MQYAILPTITRNEYLDLDQQSMQRHEFYRGEVFAMAGGTFNHSAIACNLVAIVKVSLRGKSCQPLNSDMRIHTPIGLDTYPDLSIYCGSPALQDKRRTLLNPVAIFEVLSPSTSSYDRGDKFKFYRSIPTLKDYVLIDSESILIEHYKHIGIGEWHLHEYKELNDVIELIGVNLRIAVSQIYEQIVFENDCA